MTGILKVSNIKNPTDSQSISIDRTSTDGSIINLQKDGTSVGDIGARGGDTYMATADTGIRAYDAQNAIIPVGTDGASRDAAVNLGIGSIRFNNLYLSGGAYLGGTGSANYLDDYEEGTWTPNLELGGGSTGMGYNLQTGSYTKIGRIVNLHIAISLSSKGTSTGNATIANIPFTIADAVGGGTSLEASGAVGFFNGVNNVYGNLSIVAQNTSNEIPIYRKSGATNTLSAQMTHAEINSNFEFRATITYQTT